ncbi:hypothetical protein SESBI_35392 [Sesbania bispinosa]|nr:hypothetical protein SESBI_35392 [Sesbania bispinosa]
MEDYLCRNDEIPPALVFKSVHRDITLVKDLGGYPEAKVLTFQNSKDNAILCSSLGGVLVVSLITEIPTTAVYVPGSGIISTKPLPVCLFQKHVG